MTNEKLQQIISELGSAELKDEATFGLFFHHGHEEESFIKANRQGLLCYAYLLLDAAQYIDENNPETTQNSIKLDTKSEWIDERSETFIYYVQPVVEREVIINEPHKDSFMDKLTPIGCIAAIIIFILSIPVGLYTISEWLYKILSK